MRGIRQARDNRRAEYKPADSGRFAEHVGLQAAGLVPGRLPAHGGIEREDEPAARAGRPPAPAR